MNPNRKTELLVGLFLLVGLAMVGALILQFGRMSELFTDSYTLKLAFPNAPGIKKGSPVYLGGSRIGKVKDKPVLEPDSSGVTLDIEVFGDKRIPKSSTFLVGTNGLMGDALIDIKIHGTADGSPITDFYAFDHPDVIEGARDGGLGGLQDTAASAAKKVDAALDDVKLALGDVRTAMKKINEGALSDSVIADFKDSMEHLNQTMTRVDEKVLGEENAANLKAAIGDIKDAAASFKKTAANLETTSGKLGPMIDKLDPAIAKADKVMTSADEALSAVRKGADDFAAIARAMRSGNGLVAALLNDPELKAEFSALITNLKERGILRYKDLTDEQPAPAPDARRQLFKR
jgi:phospholipid/cholesterol/gamma-HCH transport system substrate-binding protein